MSLEHDAEAEESAPEEPVAETTGDTDTETESVEPTEEAEYSGLNRRGMLLSGGLLGLLGLGVGSASADASGQIGTATDPLKKLYVDEIDGSIVDQEGGSDPALTSLVGGDLTIDENGNLSTTAGPDPISVNSDKTVIQTDNTNGINNDALNAIVLGVSNEVDGDGAVAIGGSDNFSVKAEEGAVKIGGTSGTMEATGEGSVILGGTATSHRAGGSGAVVLGGGGGTMQADGSGSVVAGQSNTAKGANSFVIGFNSSSTNMANSSFVGGQGGEAQETGSFVWAGDAGLTNNGDPIITDNGTTNKVLFNANGGFEIIASDDTAPDPLLKVNGNITTTGTVTENSSIKYKSNIRPLTTHQSEVLNLKPKQYERKQTGETEIGLIAEEVDEIVPELVKYNKDDEPDAVNYSRVGMFLAPEVSENRDRLKTVEAAREECEETIETLEVELDAKDARVADQADRIDHLESKVENKSELLESVQSVADGKDARIAELEAENAELGARLTAIEVKLGFESTAADASVTDD